MSSPDPGRREAVRSLLLAGAGALVARGVPASAASTPILSRAIPGSGERLPVIGLGTWQAFDVGDDDAKRRECAETLRALVGAGLRVVDTSPMYGSAEAVLGALLDQADPAHHAFVATKVWTTGRNAGLRQIENSFRLLRRDKLDLIQVHNLVDIDTQLATLAQLKHDGRLRYVGITHSSASAHAALTRYIERGTLDFVQVNYSLVEREAETTVLSAAAAHRVAVLINRPFADGGLFAHTGGHDLPAFAAEIGATTWAQFAIKWIISHPAVTCVIPGTRNPAHLLDNARAATGAMPDAAMRAKMAAYFDKL